MERTDVRGEKDAAVADPVVNQIVVLSGHDLPAEPNTASGGQISEPFNASNHRPYSVQWRSGLFDCLSQYTPSCCMATWVPCILLGQIQEKLHERSCSHTVVFFTLAYLMYYLLAGFDPGAGIMVGIFTWLIMVACVCKTRGIFRRQLNVQGHQATDFCASFFCTCCSLAQMARQMYSYRKPWEGCPCNATGDIVDAV